ncbi:hypothetical protein BJQ96_02053 [Flavobacterium sp. PL0002]|nr:hypothetical protein [Flavobacterium sp. PL002]
MKVYLKFQILFFKLKFVLEISHFYKPVEVNFKKRLLVHQV